METKGQQLRQAVAEEKPLQMVGVINAYSALLAKHCGYRALYLSGAGVANASCGWPDLGITTLNDVLIDAERITRASPLPLLVDTDTGWGNAFNIARAVKAFIRVGAAGLHLEDQVQAKRCGHRPCKQLVDAEEMCDRIKAAVDARTDESFVIMARSDALASEGLSGMQTRLQRYIEAGADMVFAEAVTSLTEYQALKQVCKVPLLANITEFGKTPLFTIEALRQAGVDIVLYPLSAFRAMSQSALTVYETIRTKGTQESQIAQMQTREQLYEFLDYHRYEQMLDQFGKEKKND